MDNKDPKDTKSTLPTAKAGLPSEQNEPDPPKLDETDEKLLNLAEEMEHNQGPAREKAGKEAQKLAGEQEP